MEKRYGLKSKLLFIGLIIIMISISAVGITIFSEVEMRASSAKIINNQNSIPVDGMPLYNEKNSFTKYLSLIGVNKSKLKDILNEKPNIVDEGGSDFKKAGIRIWFDDKRYTFVEQILIMNKDIDINGVKIGDNISGFKKVFGSPISNKNGDAHFRYKNVFLSINYDVLTGKTYGVYILKNNF